MRVFIAADISCRFSLVMNFYRMRGNLNYNWPPVSFPIQRTRVSRENTPREKEQAKKWNFTVTLEGSSRKLLFRVSASRSSSEGEEARSRRAPLFLRATSPIIHPPSIHIHRVHALDRYLPTSQSSVKANVVHAFPRKEIGSAIFQSFYSRTWKMKLVSRDKKWRA